MENQSRKIRPRRSFIFCPGYGSKGETPDTMAPKAIASGADIVCFELEDGVAPHHKDQARKHVIQWFEANQATVEKRSHDMEFVVRVNCLRSPAGMTDLQTIVASSCPPPGLMLPKVNNADEVRVVDELLSELGLPTRLHIIIETNDGLENAYSIAKSSQRIDALFFGGYDMASDLRCHYSWNTLFYARSRIVHAAAGARVDVLDVPFLDLQDQEGLEQETSLAMKLGFSGKGAVHPNQIPIINKIFTPSEEAVKHATRVVDAFESQKVGLVVIDGKLIEKPVLRNMYRILASAKL